MMRHKPVATIGGMLLIATLVALSSAAPATATAAITTTATATATAATATAAAPASGAPTPMAGYATVHGQEVTITKPRPGGGVIAEIYRAAPTSTGQKLLSQLQARGAALLGPPPEVDLRECATSYGSATYWCLATGSSYHVKWRWNGHSDPQVYFRDFSSAAWPVRASVTEWNRTVGIDSYWTSGNCPTTSGVHCVHVFSGNYGDTGWVGRIAIETDASGYYLDGRVSIALNDFNNVPEDNRSTACHELGHALGLGHNGSTSSCMYRASVPGVDPRFPHGTDRQTLTNILYRD